MLDSTWIFRNGVHIASMEIRKGGVSPGTVREAIVLVETLISRSGYLGFQPYSSAEL